jgi:serine/threonine protein kinase
LGAPEKITVRGRVDTVLDEIHVGPKRYYVLERLSGRERFRVFDPAAGFNGDYRVIHFLPRGRDTEQQIEVLRRLAEKNLHFPKILECARQADKLAVVTTWIWGTSLREFLADVRERKHHQPSSREVCRLFNKLAHGLSYLHVKLNVVHGDIKPANIILEKDPSRLILIDFGSAWPSERAAKKELGDGISLPYAAPEQLIPGAAVDFRADIFSLTVVLFEMLTLEIPYDGVGGLAGLPENRLDFAGKGINPSEKISDGHLIPRSAVRALDQFALRGLGINPNERFSDRSSWLKAFDELLSEFRAGTRLGFFGKWFLHLLDRFAGKKS